MVLGLSVVSDDSDRSPSTSGEGRGVHGPGPHGGTHLSGERAPGRNTDLPGPREKEVELQYSWFVTALFEALMLL